MKTKAKSFPTETDVTNASNRTAAPLTETALLETVRDPEDPKRPLFLLCEDDG